MKVDDGKSRSLSSSEVELESASVQLERDRFIERLRSLIPKRGENQLAIRAGISPSGLRGALRNGNPGREMLVAIALATGVNVEWLATGEGPRERPAADGTVPVGSGEGRERRPAPEPSGDKSLRYQGSRGTGQRQEGPPPIPTFDAGQPLAGFVLVKLQRLAACLAAAQRLPEELETGAQLMLAIRIQALIDYLVAQGADQGLIDQEDIDAMARLLFKLIKDQEGGLKEG